MVEQPSDVIKLEKSNFFRGLYHVLGGRLSPLDRVGPEDLSIAKMEKRLADEPAEGSRPRPRRRCGGRNHRAVSRAHPEESRHEVSRLAMGLPAGGGLEYADSVTLGYALSGRREL